jgi:hypothetical protein
MKRAALVDRTGTRPDTPHRTGTRVDRKRGAHVTERSPAAPIDDPTIDADSDGLVRLTVDLTPSAYRALMRSVEVGGDSPTDTVGRALLFYLQIQQIAATGRSGRFTYRTKAGAAKQVRVSDG